TPVATLHLLPLSSAITSILLFFFTLPPPPPLSPLPLHDALPISRGLPLLFAQTHQPPAVPHRRIFLVETDGVVASGARHSELARSEEHTSELQSLTNLVCRLLLEKKKN